MINHQVFETSADVVEHLAQTMQSYSEQGRPVHISLSGGSTPKMLFERLAKAPYATDILWQNLHFWWGDERCVAPTDAQSNYGEANALLFSQVDIPAQNIHRILGENEPEQEAERFAKEMAEVIPTNAQGIPVFDWILLGVGADGHTASLFPHQTNYDEEKLAIVALHPESKQVRVSKSAKVLQAAKRIHFLVLGEGKAAIVHEIQSHDANDLPYPAAKIKSHTGETVWVLDNASASQL
ncbi:MAG: 6-phosphogluconolactonase [Vibrio sp.]